VCKVIKQVPHLPRVFHHVWNQNGNVAYRKFLVSSILWAGKPPPAANPARIVLRHSCSDQSAVREVHVSREIGTLPLSIGFYLMHHQLVVSSPLKKCVYDNMMIKENYGKLMENNPSVVNRRITHKIFGACLVFAHTVII
jgi:hypothetical protein